MTGPLEERPKPLRLKERLLNERLLNESPRLHHTGGGKPPARPMSGLGLRTVKLLSRPFGLYQDRSTITLASLDQLLVLRSSLQQDPLREPNKTQDESSR